MEIENKVREGLGISLIATAEGETAAKPAKGKKTEKAAAVADEDGVIG